MKCEKCEKEHDGSYGSGRFCNEKCARSYSTSNIDRSKIKIVQCIECNKDIEVSIHSSPKQCKCGNCRKRKKYVIEKRTHCLNCSKEMDNIRKYCDINCQVDHQHKQYIKKWKNGDIDGLQNSGMFVSKYVRRYLWEKYNDKCSKCGWDIPNPITGKPILEIEHIDGNHKNNREENLNLICPNCHSLTPTYKALNYGKAGNRHVYFGHKKAPTAGAGSSLQNY